VDRRQTTYARKIFFFLSPPSRFGNLCLSSCFIFESRRASFAQGERFFSSAFSFHYLPPLFWDLFIQKLILLDSFPFPGAGLLSVISPKKDFPKPFF